MSRIPFYLKYGMPEENENPTFELPYIPVMGSFFVAKKVDLRSLVPFKPRTAHADTDLFLDEAVLPEFSIELEELGEYQRNKYQFSLKTRDQHLKEMMSGEEYDIVVIGAGASGAGVALDAASRGLRVAVIDKNDFGSATSSKSTKLAHGGIRYLEQMFKRQGNVKQSYALLKEALAERNYFLDSNPFQNTEVKIVIPDKSFLSTVFYNFPGTLVYHLIYRG